MNIMDIENKYTEVIPSVINNRDNYSDNQLKNILNLLNDNDYDDNNNLSIVSDKYKYYIKKNNDLIYIDEDFKIFLIIYMTDSEEMSSINLFFPQDYINLS